MSKGVEPMCKKYPNGTFEFEMKIVQIIYIVIRAFFKYLACNIQCPIFTKEDYPKFFKFSIKFFTDRFSLYKNEFATVHKILLAKEKKLSTEQAKNFEFLDNNPGSGLVTSQQMEAAIGPEHLLDDF